MNITTQGTMTPAGVVQYDPNTGAKLATGQSVQVAEGGNTYGSRKMIEPGVYKTDTGYTNSTGQSISYTPAMQTTTSLDRQDKTIATKIDQVSGATAQTQAQTGNTPTVGNVQTTGTNPDGTPKTPSYKSPDGKATISEKPIAGSYAYKAPTTLLEGEKVGYGTDGKRYIIGKDGTTRNDPFADQEYTANQDEINREAERNTLFDSMKQNLDSAHIQLLDSIKSTFAVRRSKMEDINARYTALKQNEGFSGGQARYMSDINNGVLRDTEEQGQIRLSEIDAQEKTLIAQAVQAKTDKDFELAFKKMAEFDKLQKEKADTIQKVYKAAVDYNKALDDQAKELRQKEKEMFEQGTKTLTASAPALIKGYDFAKTKEDKAKFIQEYSKKLNVPPEMVLGAIEDQRTQNEKTARDTIKADAELQQTYAQTRASDRSNQPKSSTTVDEFGNEITMSKEEADKIQKQQDFFTKVDQRIAGAGKDEQGVPIVTAGGMFTPQGKLTYAAFKELVTIAEKNGISRQDVIDRYQAKLNLSTFARSKSGYGLTDAEYTKIKNANK